MSRIFVLNNRTFSVPQQTTARQDGYMLAMAVEAGVMRYAGKGKALDDDTILEMVATVLKSGRREHLLAGGLVEDGVKWTPAEAEKNAEFFGDLTDPADKAQMDTGFVDVLAAFFQTALRSSTPFPSASSAEVVAEPAGQNSSDNHSTADSAPVPAATGAR